MGWFRHGHFLKHLLNNNFFSFLFFRHGSTTVLHVWVFGCVGVWVVGVGEVGVGEVGGEVCVGTYRSLLSSL